MKKILLFSLLCSLVVSSSVSAKITYNARVPLPGASKANLKLQADTLMPVYTAAGIKVPKCTKLSIYDTAILKQPHDMVMEDGKYVSGSWSEQWAVKACGQNVYVPIEFVLDKDGATYLIDNSKVHF